MTSGDADQNALWRRAQAIFEAVVELSDEERQERLSELGEADAELIRLVEELLATDRASHATGLDESLWPTTLALLAGPNGEGARLGPYRLGELIGAGGMGEVYAAERVDGEFQRRVAVKLLPAVAGKTAVERFRRERQILANLTHPSIAMLLDGGVAEGRPFLVMERIDGVSITDFCRQQRTSLDQRIDLLRQVAGAVAHAHCQRVVHRDIKPPNILVTAEGLPKLLDFGIAELMAEPSRGEPASAPLLASQRLSPGYCAPEQLVGASAEMVSDIFSLGVVLFELLTGRLPFGQAGGSLAELGRAMAAGPPVLAETLPDGEALRVLADERRCTPRRLRRLLSGDLQAVIDRALAPQPAQRYASAAALADDLQRWQERRPVLARPATVGYRLRKLVARRRAMVLVGAVALVALLLATSLQWARQRDRQHQQALAANLEQRADRSVEMLLDVVRLADPAERLGRPLTAEEVLSRGEERARSELADDDAARARVLATLAKGYCEIGDLQKAGQLAAEALALRRREHDDGGAVSAAVLAESLDQLGEIRRLQGLFDEAEALGREALALWRSLDGVAPAVIARTLDNLAETLHELGHYAAAEPLYRESLTLRRAGLGADHPLVAESLAHLGLLLKNRGRPEDALELYRAALELRRRVLAPAHPDIAESLYLVGTMEGFLGHPEAARSDLEAAVELHRNLYGEGHPKTLLVLHDLGVLLVDLDRPEEAEPILRRVLAARQALYPDPHPELAQSYTALAALLYDRHDLKGARDLIERSVEINRQLFGPHHPYVLNDLLSLALFETGLGHLETAEQLLRRALEGYREAVEPTHRDLCRTLILLGDLASQLGRSDAEPLLREGTGCFRRALGEEHATTRWAEGKLERHRERS